MFSQFQGNVGFSPDGRLLQNEYAGKAAAQGPLIIGVVGKSCIVLLSQKQNTNPLAVSSEIDTIMQISDKIYSGVSGIGSDSRSFVNKLRAIAAQHRTTYGTEIGVQTLVNSGLDSLHPNNNNLGYPTRPLGSSFLIAGFDESAGPKLFRGTTAASAKGCFAGAIGTGAEVAEAYLSEHFEKGLSDDAAQQLAISALNNVDRNSEYTAKVVK